MWAGARLWSQTEEREEKGKSQSQSSFPLSLTPDPPKWGKQLHVPPATVPSPPGWVVFSQTLSQSVFFSLRLLLTDVADGREQGWAVVQKMEGYPTSHVSTELSTSMRTEFITS